MIRHARHLLQTAALAAVATFAIAAAPAPHLKSAVYAGGCFWSMEHDMEHIPGVVDVVSGYAGGTRPNPTYPDHDGYLESVKVTYDPAKISYADLTLKYLHTTDPTDGGGAFCDRGPSYRPAIFVADAGERSAAEADIRAAQPHAKGRIVTAVVPAGRFWKAEDYHQDYARKHPMEYGAYRMGCGKDASLRRVWH